MKKYIIVILIITLLITLGIIKTQDNIKFINKQNTQTVTNSVNQPNTFNLNNPEPSRHIEHKIYNVPLPIEDQILIQDECRKYGLSPEYILAIIQAESTFNSKAISTNKTSLGLMQLNKNTYPWVAKQLDIKNFDPYNSRHNIQAGIWYINHLRNYWYSKGYDDENIFDLILISYNLGVDGCNKYVSKHGLNYSYVNKIIKYKDNIERNN